MALITSGCARSDMLECNNSLTDAESASYFALWAVMKAPLLVGTDLTAVRHPGLKLNIPA